MTANEYATANYHREEVFPKLCACGKPMHPEAQGPHCAACEMEGYREELRSNPWDIEIQHEFAKWVCICVAEEVALLPGRAK